MSSFDPPSQSTAPPASSTPWLTAIAEVMRGKQLDYTTGSLSRAIALLAVPMVLEMAGESVFALCDALFVKELGDGALSVVALTEAMLTIIYALAMGLSMSVTAMVARRIGEKDVFRAERAAAQGVHLGIRLGVLIGVPAAWFAPDLLHALGASATIVESGSTYTSIMLGSNVVILLLFLNNAVFRGAGDPVIAMRALLLANAINLVLDPCLIFGLGPFPELGVTGAAVATTIGRAAGVAYQFALLRRGASRIRLGRVHLRVHTEDMRKLLRMSIGGVAQMLIATASWLVLVGIITNLTDDEVVNTASVAGYQVAIRVLLFALLPAFGLSNSAATLVGQNLGAQQPERATRSVMLTGMWTMAFLGVVAVVFYALAPAIIEMFVSARTQDPDTMRRVGVECLRTLSLGNIAYAWGMVMMQAFNGSGRTMVPTWINLGCFWALEIPLAWILAHPAGLGVTGVFWAIVVSESTLALVAVSVFVRLRWK